MFRGYGGSLTPDAEPFTLSLMKKMLIIVVVAALAGWAIWHQFIREKTLGEKIDSGLRKTEKAVDNAVKKITP